LLFDHAQDSKASMKLFALVTLITATFLVSARADLTIVEKVEGSVHGTEMSIKIKGDKTRVDIAPEVTTIIDSKTGDFITLMNNEKKFIRMSADQISAVAEMAARFTRNKESTEKPKLTPTGRKETINGYEAEEYTYQSPLISGSCWISSNFPDGAAILKQLQAIKPEAWKNIGPGLLNYRDFPGFPIKSQFSVGGQQMTTTVMSVKQDALNEAEFGVPADFQEMKVPTLFNGKLPAMPAVPPPKP